MFLDLLDLFADPTWSCRGQWIKLGPNCKEEKTVQIKSRTLVIIFSKAVVSSLSFSAERAFFSSLTRFHIFLMLLNMRWHD